MVDSSFGDRLTVRIDPNWPHRALWRHPLGETLRFTYMDFDQGVTEGVTPNYVAPETVGRAEAFKTYINTPNRAISVTFKFRAQGLDGGAIPSQTIETEVLQPIRFLDALKYPVFNPQQGISYAPPPVILKIGTLLTARCVLTAGDAAWDYEPMDPDTFLPQAAMFAATFEVVRTFKADLSYFPSGSSGGPISGTWE